MTAIIGISRVAAPAVIDKPLDDARAQRIIMEKKRDKVHLHIQFARDSLPRHSLGDGGCHVPLISNPMHRRQTIITDQALIPYFFPDYRFSLPVFQSETTL